jgi:ATP-binding cassette subfamily C protein
MVRGETVADPIDAIARASRIRVRRVTLAGEWWTQDNGPFLAFLAEGHRPVAVLPASPRAYELHDPRERTRRQVTAAVAAALEPSVHVFYRSLADEASSAWDLVKFGSLGRGRDVFRLMVALGSQVTVDISQFQRQVLQLQP